jgi:hypothetical protein
MPELFAFYYKNCGVEGMEQVFNHYRSKSDIYGYRESLNEIAGELQAVGLHTLADMVHEFAETQRSRFDEYYNRYKNSKDPVSFRYWKHKNEIERKRYYGISS